MFVFFSASPLSAMDEVETKKIVSPKPTMPQKLTYEMLKNITKMGFVSTLKGHYVFSVTDEDMGKNQYSPLSLLEKFNNSEKFNVLLRNICIDFNDCLTFYLEKYCDFSRFRLFSDFEKEDGPKNLEFKGYTYEYILILTHKNKYLDLDNVKSDFKDKKRTKKGCNIL